MKDMEPDPQRRIDLDWIRIGAFLVLILYHVGMYYVTWDWHVKSPSASRALEPLMLAVNPWRLALLFLVSGAATAFMLRRLAPAGLAKARSLRLLVPLVFGMFVVVPPQAWYEVVEKAGYAGSYGEFYLRYLAADASFCRGKDCLVLPTWNHLWFVAYLWAYTMLLAALLAWRGSWREALERRLEVAARGWGILLWPWAVLTAIRMLLVARFPSTHDLVGDWHNHAFYFTVFAFGFVAARVEAAWAAMERMRRVAAGLAVASYAFLLWYFQVAYVGQDVQPPPDWLRFLQRGIYALNIWAAIVAICGFARRLVRHDGPARRYLTDAIFPFYIVHQTAIVAFAVWLRPLALPAALEGVVLLALTAAACVLAFEVVRRLRPLRPLFGLKAQLPPQGAAA
jgi:hypothetical protein